MIQVEKGTGVQLNFDNDTDFRSDFASNVLRKNESNRVFYVSLVHKILEKACYKDKILVITRNEKIQMNLKGTLAHINILSGLDNSLCLFLCSQRYKGYLRANDTDAVVILVPYLPDFLEINSNVKSAKNCYFYTLFEVVIILQAFFTLKM